MDRAEIIREIQVIAKRDGKVPGRLRFESVTGLSQHDWCGKYWARWNDAIAEAGLSPNEKQEAIPEEVLLGAFLDLAIKIDRIPADGDLRLHTRSNPDAPSHSTYQKRFGPKQALLKKVLDFAEARGAPEHLLDAMRASISDAATDAESDATGETAIQGYVYLLKSGRRYKIGKTTSTLRRLGQLAIELPDRSEPIHTIETDDPAGIEAYWHNRFRDKRLNGEWFELTAADVRAFKRRRKFM